MSYPSVFRNTEPIPFHNETRRYTMYLKIIRSLLLKIPRLPTLVAYVILVSILLVSLRIMHHGAGPLAVLLLFISGPVILLVLASSWKDIQKAKEYYGAIDSRMHGSMEWVIESGVAVAIPTLLIGIFSGNIELAVLLQGIFIGFSSFVELMLFRHKRTTPERT